MKNEQMLTLITKVKGKVKRLENTSIGNLMDAVEELETKAQTSIDEIEAIKNRLTSLETRLIDYKNHTHGYEDNNGTITTNKNTAEVN